MPAQLFGPGNDPASPERRRKANHGLQCAWVLATVLTLPCVGLARSYDVRAIDAHLRDADRQGLVDAAAGKPALVYFEFENQQSTPIPPGISFECRLLIPGGRRPIVAASWTNKEPVPAFTRGTATMTFGSTGEPGRRTLRCSADRDNRLRETNERNNVMTKSVALNRVNSVAYRVRLSDFSEFRPRIYGGRETGWACSDFTLENSGMATPDKQFGNFRPMWQADCRPAEYPIKGLRGKDSSTRDWVFLQGELPDSGTSTELKACTNRYHDRGVLPLRKLAPSLTYSCDVRVGAFMIQPTVMQSTYSGRSYPITTWMPQQVWWSTRTTHVIKNPFSEQTPKPPTQDLRFDSISTMGNVRIQATVRANEPSPLTEILCRVKQGSLTRRTVKKTTAIMPLPPASSFTASLTFDLPPLPVGSYEAECELDPDDKVAESSAGNNVSRRAFTIQ